jgi:hypothetical protein
MNQQEREAYIRMREEEVNGRREPTLDTASLPALSRRSDEIISRTAAAYERSQAFEHRRRQETRSSYAKLGLWLLVWFCMMCLCEQAAQVFAPNSPDISKYFLEASGTAVMLLITFWRIVWALMWWVIGIVIVLAIIKGAFLIVFTL